jgi:energy-coupling factor transport system permease protein
MNPSVKFITVAASMLVIAFFFNPWTPFLFWAGILLVQILFSRVQWKKWALFMLPFTFGAFGYLWTAIVFGANPGGEAAFRFAGFEISEAQLLTAVSLAFRVMAFSTLSLLFAFTTDPVKFIMSLMQQLKLSPKLAYSIMVAYQFLPLIKEEYIQIRDAHRLRGAGTATQGWQSLFAQRRLLLPMLAGAVRKAERAAFAMEARGFTGERRIAYYRPVRVGRIDGWMALLFLIVLAASCMGGVYLSG